MRQHRKRGRAMQPRIGVAVDLRDHLGDRAVALLQPLQDRALAHLAVRLEPAHEFARLLDRAAMAGQEEPCRDAPAACRARPCSRPSRRRAAPRSRSTSPSHGRRRTGCRCLPAQRRHDWRRARASGSCGSPSRRRRSTPPSASVISGTNSMSALASSGLISPILSGRAGRCGPSAQTMAPVCVLELAGERRMVAMGVADEDVADRPPADRRKQRGKMRLVVGPGIDHRQIVAADDIAVGAVEGERAGIVRRQPPHARPRPRPAGRAAARKRVSNSSDMSVPGRLRRKRVAA